MPNFDPNKFQNYTFHMKFLNYVIKSDVAFYNIHIFSKEDPNLKIDFTERYSSLAEYHKLFKEESKSKNFPAFPPTKLFGNTDEKFLSKRLAQLDTYFSVILADKELSQMKSVKKWLYELFNKFYVPVQKTQMTTNPIIEPKVITNINNQIKVNQTQGNQQVTEPKQLVDKKEILNKCNAVIEKYTKQLIDLSEETNQNIADDEILLKEKKYSDYISKIKIKSKLFMLPKGDDANFESLGQVENINLNQISEKLKISINSKNSVLLNQSSINGLITNII